MKLIIKQYLSSLRERDELDAILPDLLSEMGLNVYSRPARGTRQDGVDVAAVGSVGDGPEQVYLFSIKAGDLTRAAWDGSDIQSLRPSLNEIRDSYIPNRLPNEHKDKPIVICLCFGGDIREQVRPLVEGYIKQNSTKMINYEEWNGDKLAALILENFLREDLLPEKSRSLLRKSLALLDEPEASFEHFSRLVSGLFEQALNDDSRRPTYARQMCLCLWILFAWSRDAGTVEPAYLAAERTLLLAWELTKNEFDKKNKVPMAVCRSFWSVLQAYQQITATYIGEKILPNVGVLDGLSAAVKPSSSVDVNLKLFDVLGRLSTFGLWSMWSSAVSDNDDEKEQWCKFACEIGDAVKSLINNNEVLCLPIKEDQTIDIFLALLLLSATDGGGDYMRNWLHRIAERALFAYESFGPYPCTIQDYAELLDHPRKRNREYRIETTEGSILYPTIALWAAIFQDVELYQKVADFKSRQLEHCNFQLWYPDDISEDSFYSAKVEHGAMLSHVPVDMTPDVFLAVVWGECDKKPYFGQLSAHQRGLWPLILVACRHYRVPVPIHFTLTHRGDQSTGEACPETLDN